MELIAYARASTEDQQITLADQQDKLRTYAKLYEHEIVEMVVGSESAKTIDDRDDFQHVLQLLRDDVAEGLLVLKLDRLARDVGDGAHLLKLYFGEDAKYQKHLFSVNDYIDTRTANGRMMFNMQLVIAQWERETIAERTKSALAYKIKSGQRVGEIRYGFSLGDDGCTLSPIEQEQTGLALMRTLRDAGWTFAAIAGELDKRGFPTKKGGAWHYNSVRRILKRPA